MHRTPRWLVQAAAAPARYRVAKVRTETSIRNARGSNPLFLGGFSNMVRLHAIAGAFQDFVRVARPACGPRSLAGCGTFQFKGNVGASRGYLAFDFHDISGMSRNTSLIMSFSPKPLFGYSTPHLEGCVGARHIVSLEETRASTSLHNSASLRHGGGVERYPVGETRKRFGAIKRISGNGLRGLKQSQRHGFVGTVHETPVNWAAGPRELLWAECTRSADVIVQERGVCRGWQSRC
mmetsp:Transcript_107617/g.303060  ORF Transcript_107617/g.303060 Transcript_107617/m.303060 type:complete len:236 (+) Transcript_107617:567-1274(+)